MLIQLKPLLNVHPHISSTKNRGGLQLYFFEVQTPDSSDTAHLHSSPHSRGPVIGDARNRKPRKFIQIYK